MGKKVELSHVGVGYVAHCPECNATVAGFTPRVVSWALTHIITRCREVKT